MGFETVVTRSGIDEMEFGTLHTNDESDGDWLVFGEDMESGEEWD